ncbi:hypothetical protein VA7868_03363 [Vibrio aerogenes CECT 7868]|uniref:AraC-type arabinose-binding/dimerisation domain-containing protein n=1 Tax=Vibrio aerogenes CECT 7868 TaxID=1216006 RepID=A0A1M5ZXY2_9VIBR|nr:hypothetical protein [Vibrio aerogenes]SHI28743.1 hypothetical protein VA7868_03363 [Vibrio aerogenes CECT 7868]
MHYAIQSECFQEDFLIFTARKKSLKHQFFLIEEGMMLLRLGKSEYIVAAGQAIWIPFRCLNALTFLPGTRGVHVEFSARLADIFPSQAGYVSPSGLCLSLLQRLKNATRKEAVFVHLTAVLKDEMQQFSPSLPAAQTKQVLHWQAQKSAGENRLSAEVHTALLVREAQKMKLSGSNSVQIADTLFQGQLTQYQQMRQLILGENSQSGHE